MKNLTVPSRPTNAAYRAGWESGILHDGTNRLCADNLSKMKAGIASDMPLIRAYWQGYKMGMENPTGFFKSQT